MIRDAIDTKIIELVKKNEENIYQKSPEYLGSRKWR